MSITAKDLQEIFDGLGKAFGPGDVSHAAQSVGGRVIDGLHPATTNAKEMTRLLGGGGGGGGTSQRYSATGSAKSFAEQLGASTSTNEATGSRSKPFTVEFSQGSVMNLAKQIGQATGGAGGKPESGLQRFLNGFGAGAAYGPLAFAGRRIRGMFGGEADTGGATKDKGTGGIPEWIQRIRDNKVGAGNILGKGYARALQYGETFTGTPKEGGFSSIMPGPRGVPATPSAGLSGATTGLTTVAGDLAELAGEVGGTVTSFADVLVTTIGVTEALKNFGEATVEGNRHLAKWNGGLAVAMAQLDIATIQREQHMAQATGGTATMTATEFGKLAEEWQPIAEDLSTIKNLAGTGAVEIARLLTGILKVVDTIFGPILRATEKYLGSTDGLQAQPMKNLFDFLKTQNARSETRDVHAARATNARAKRPAKASAAERAAGAYLRGGVGGVIADKIAEHIGHDRTLPDGGPIPEAP